MASHKSDDSTEIDLNNVQNKSKDALKRILRNIKDSSGTQQLVMGAGSGWMTGFITMKVGKTTAFLVGSGIILLQVAQNQGYIKIDWSKVKDKVHITKEDTKVINEAPHFLKKVKKFAQSNTAFAAGFIGGFFLGVAS